MSTYAEILTAFNDVTGNSGQFFFTSAQVDRFANRGMNEICERSRPIDDKFTANIVSGTSEYSLAKEAYDIWRVEYDDEVLYPITRNSLRHAERDWSTRTGLPRFYYLDEITSNQGYMSVGLWETPGTNVTQGLDVYYHGVPTTLSTAGSASSLEIPEWASGAVLYYMLNIAYLADTKIQDEGSAAVYQLLYDDVMERLMIRANDRIPKKWRSGSPSWPSRSVLNRLPQRITP